MMLIATHYMHMHDGTFWKFSLPVNQLNSNCLRVAAMTIVLGRGLVRELDETGSRGIEVYLIRRG